MKLKSPNKLTLANSHQMRQKLKQVSEDVKDYYSNKKERDAAKPINKYKT